MTKYGLTMCLIGLFLLNSCSSYQKLRTPENHRFDQTISREDIGKWFRVYYHTGERRLGKLVTYDAKSLVIRQKTEEQRIYYQQIIKIEKFHPYRRGPVIFAVTLVSVGYLSIKAGQAYANGLGDALREATH